MSEEELKVSTSVLSMLIHQGLINIFIFIELQRTLIGFCRDLRGVALAFNNRISYMMLFNWMHPRVIVRISELCLQAIKGLILDLSIQMVNRSMPMIIFPLSSLLYLFPWLLSIATQTTLVFCWRLWMYGTMIPLLLHLCSSSWQSWCSIDHRWARTDYRECCGDFGCTMPYCAIIGKLTIY